MGGVILSPNIMNKKWWRKKTTWMRTMPEHYTLLCVYCFENWLHQTLGHE